MGDTKRISNDIIQNKKIYRLHFVKLVERVNVPIYIPAMNVRYLNSVYVYAL